MLGYVIRRLLLMIPTFIGILIINFAVLRLQGPTLVEQMQVAGGMGEGATAGGGDRKVQGAAKDVENYLDRFRRSGNDLPAIINLRGFHEADEYARWLRDTIANGRYHGKPSARNRLEKEMWLAGPQAVAPLTTVLADESNADIHVLAAQALTYCAYITLNPRDFSQLPAE